MGTAIFLARADPYDGEHPFPLLVERVESLIAKETSAWGQYIRSAGKPKAPSAEAAVSPQEEVQWSERYEAVAVAADTAADESLNASDTAFDWVKEGARDVANLLPEEVDDKIVVMASKAEQGVETVRDVVEAGSTLAEVAKAQEVLGGSAQASPLKAIVEKALASFTPALGTRSTPHWFDHGLGNGGHETGRCRLREMEGARSPLALFPRQWDPLAGSRCQYRFQPPSAESYLPDRVFEENEGPEVPQVSSRRFRSGGGHEPAVARLWAARSVRVAPGV